MREEGSNIVEMTLAELAIIMFFLMSTYTLYERVIHEAEMQEISGQVRQAGERAAQAQHEANMARRERDRAQETIRGYVGHIACIEKDNKPEYSYDLTIHANTISVRKTAAMLRREASGGIRGMPWLIHAPSANIPIATFRDRAKRLYKWSMRQRPECRHYVILREGEDMGRYKEHRLNAVEKYFYTKEK